MTRDPGSHREEDTEKNSDPWYWPQWETLMLQNSKSYSLKQCASSNTLEDTSCRLSLPVSPLGIARGGKNLEAFLTMRKSLRV